MDIVVIIFEFTFIFGYAKVYFSRQGAYPNDQKYDK